MLRQSTLFIAMLALVVSACAPVATPAAPSATQVPPTKAAPTVAAPTATAAPTAAPATDMPLQPVATETSAPAVVGAIDHLAAGQALSLSMVQMLDANTGWGVAPADAYGNDHIMKTVDGGLTWQDVTPPERAGTTEDFQLGQGVTTFFLDANNGWATFYDRAGGQIKPPTTVWVTTDGGQSWGASVIDVGSTEGLYQPTGIMFSDAQNGALLATLDVGMSQSRVAVLTSNDGGKSWNRVVDPDKDNIPTACSKDAIAFTDAQHGWIVGNCGGVVAQLFVYQTTDGGNTWTLVDVPAPEGQPVDVFTSDANACYAYGLKFTGTNGQFMAACSPFDNFDNTSRWLYLTTDGGQTWASHALPNAYGDLTFVGTTGWLIGSPTFDTSAGTELFQSTDGGATWKSLHKQLWTGTLSFVDAQVGWVAAKSADGSYALVKSVDGGVKWTVVAPMSK